MVLREPSNFKQDLAKIIIRERHAGSGMTNDQLTHWQTQNGQEMNPHGVEGNDLLIGQHNFFIAAPNDSKKFPLVMIQ